jgi:hypothetical protein
MSTNDDLVGITARRWRVPMVARDADEQERASIPLELLFDLTFVVAVAAAARTAGPAAIARAAVVAACACPHAGTAASVAGGGVSWRASVTAAWGRRSLTACPRVSERLVDQA